MTGKALTPELAEKERQAAEYRVAGFDYPTIAEKLGYANASGAFKAVQRALKRTLREPAEQVRELELARLDELHKGLWDRAKRGDLYSVDRALRIAERRAELQGLDAPKKIAPTTPDGTQAAPLIGIIEVVRPDDDGDA